LKISELPILKEFIKILENLGYVDLYPPQEEAIKSGVLEGRNLLLTTPTASGKTLVAMLAAVRAIVKGGKVVYLTPLRALANEKYKEFKILEGLKKKGKKIKIIISTGDYDSPSEFLGTGDILIMTNEKFDSILRHGAPWINEVKLFVADEIHVVGDTHRGPTLEMTVTKIISYARDAQILALSATIKNSEELAKWIKADLIDMDWRPVDLIEGIYNYGQIFFSDESIIKVGSTNRGPAIDVATDVLSKGGQSLIFANTRKSSVSLALKASEVVQHYLTDEEKEKVDRISKTIISEGEETQLSRILSQLVKNGTAFHHAGLSSMHRGIIEDNFRKGLIKVITSTPTLAAGVNLPARRVVINSLFRYNSDYGGRTPISVLEYKQMCGRAGRPKYDKIGENVIIATTGDTEEIFYHYVKGEPEPILSRLYNDSALRIHLLATIASFPSISDTKIMEIFSKSLLAIQYKRDTYEPRIEKAKDYLIEEGLVKKRERFYFATEFGRKISTLYIDPATGVLFKRALNFAEKGRKYSLGWLHLIVSSPDFSPKFPFRNKDFDEACTLFELHKDEFLIPLSDSDSFGDYSQHSFEDFRSLLVLYGWINEWNEVRLMDKLGAEPGDVHRAVETAEWLTHSLYEISRLQKRADLLNTLNELLHRIKQGIKPELILLTGFNGIGRVRARSLFNNGYTDSAKLSEAPLERIAAIPKIGLTIAKGIKKQLLQ
jgi:helicase